MSNFFYLDQNAQRSPYFNLALEEALAINLSKFAFSGGIRFWKNENSAILGISDSLSKNIVPEKLAGFRENFDTIIKMKNPSRSRFLFVARRCSGGGTVFHEGRFNLNYSLFASVKEKPELYPVKESYERLLQFLIESLKAQGIEAKFLGKSDLAVEENSTFKKISGNAQFRKKDAIVQHGTLILSKELIEKVHEVLAHPPEEPDYRKNRKHSDFITSLPAEFGIEKFKLDLQKNFRAYLGAENPDKITEKKFLKQVFIDAKTLLTEKYANREYIFSRD